MSYENCLFSPVSLSVALNRASDVDNVTFSNMVTGCTLGTNTGGLSL